jgi:hypothetical protein
MQAAAADLFRNCHLECMEMSKMAQNTQDGQIGVAAQDSGIRLQIPGMDKFRDLKFSQSEDTPSDLVIQFPDGTELVIPNYIPLAQAGAAPDLTLADGTVVPGAEIVGLIDNLDFDKIATAAGDPGAGGQTTTGGGAGFLADPSGLLGDDIGHGPYAGGIEIGDQVGFEQLPSQDDSNSSSSSDLPFEAIDDHVIHNIQAEDDFGYQGSGFSPLTNPVDIPDAALRHNDIYPRGTWDLTLVDNPSPDYNPTYTYPGGSTSDPFPADPFEVPTVDNSDHNPGSGVLGESEFNGTNTTSRFTGTTTIPESSPPLIGIQNNDGDFYFELDQAHETTQVGQVERVDWDLGRFVLQTEAPGGSQPDWDGTRIYLYDGETITMTPESWKPAQEADYTPIASAYPGPRSDVGGAWNGPNYWMGIDVDRSAATGSDPLFPAFPEAFRFGWDYLEQAQNGSLSYEVPIGGEGWYYLGIGNIPDNVTPEGMYRTLVEVDGVPYGEFDYDATDFVLADDAHVTVDAREEGELYDSGDAGRGMVDVIDGTAGDDIIISSHWSDDLFGHGGDDVLIGRGGDDHLTGGADRDLFLFEDAAIDGNDTIFDFNLGENDIINLDILFDNLGVASADREVLQQEISGDTILTIGDGTGTDTQHLGATGFSITLDDTAGLNLAQLTANGNLVVDES